jgi:hypothetical protein
LAAKAKVIGRNACLKSLRSLTPETLLAWHRKLIAQKYDGSSTGAEGECAHQSNKRQLPFVLESSLRSPYWTANQDLLYPFPPQPPKADELVVLLSALTTVPTAESPWICASLVSVLGESPAVV